MEKEILQFLLKLEFYTVGVPIAIAFLGLVAKRIWNSSDENVKGSDKWDHSRRSLANSPNHSKHWR